MASRGKAITVNWGLKLDGQPNTHTLSARPSARAIAAFNATQGAGSPFGPRSPQVEKQLQHISEAMQSIQQQQQRSQAPATWGSPSQTAEATAAIEYTRQRTEETFRLLQTVQADTAQVRAAVAAQERAIQGVQVTVTGARQDIHQQGVTQGQYHQEQLAAHGNNSRLLQSFQGAITNYLAEETRRTQPQAAPTPPAPHSTAHSAERCPTWPVAALFPGEPPAARRVHFSPDTPMEAPPHPPSAARTGGSLLAAPTTVSGPFHYPQVCFSPPPLATSNNFPERAAIHRRYTSDTPEANILPIRATLFQAYTQPSNPNNSRKGGDTPSVYSSDNSRQPSRKGDVITGVYSAFKSKQLSRKGGDTPSVSTGVPPRHPHRQERGSPSLHTDIPPRLPR